MKSEAEMSRRANIVNTIGITLVVLSYAGALLNMLNTKRVETWGDKKVLRICHWQLESGFREGINFAIREFEKQNPDVKIIQLPIYQAAYQQFVRTQLIGGTAPDLVEIDIVSGAAAQMVGRYFYPLSKYLYQPNEYNADNEFKDVPWVHTYRDGLQYAINASDLEFYSAGMNNFSTRLLYNKTLLRTVMGCDTIPKNYRAFIAMCDSIMSYSKQTGHILFPIAGANYQTGWVRGDYYNALTPEYFFLLDKNFETTGGGYLKLCAYLRNDFSLNSPQLRAAEEASKRLAKYYQPGFMAQNRMDAGFAFSQQRALMISSGSWDYQSMAMQARDNGFEIGVSRFPLPSQDDPEFGSFTKGGLYEGDWTGVKFAISRNTKHFDAALRFLKFMTSQKMNGEINKVIGWMPAIRDAYVPDEMKPFLKGYKGWPAWPEQNLDAIGNKTRANDQQAYWEYISGTTNFDQFVAAIEKRYIIDGMFDVYLDLLSQLDEIKGCAHDRSYYSAMMAVSANADNRPEYLAKLKAMTSTYQGYRFGIADRGYGLWEASQLNNDRVAKIKEVSEYKSFMKRLDLAGDQK